MKKIMSFFMTGILIFGLSAVPCEKANARCEEALARLNKAEADLAGAEAEDQKARANLNKAQANLNNAVQALNAVAAKLGASGKATDQSIAFGRPASGETFFDNPEYKAAKQAWQDAKNALGGAEGDLDRAGTKRARARDEYEDAKKEYERLKALHERDKKVGDAGFLMPPGELEIDKGLDEKVEKITRPKKSHTVIKQDNESFDISFTLNTVKNRTILETHVIGTGEDARHGKWSPQKMSLVTDSTVLSPVETHDYYVSKVSEAPVRRKAKTAASVSPLAFSAFGGQYASGTTKSAQHGGASCPTGAPQESAKANSWGSTLGGVGTSAALGLLTRQQAAREPAGRQPTRTKTKGLKSTFDVTGREAKLEGADLKVELMNEAEGKTVYIVVPARFHKQDIKGDAGEKCPYQYCTGGVNYVEYEWTHKSHEAAKEVKRQNVGRKDKVTYSAKVKFDVTKKTVYWETFKCSLPKGHTGDHEGAAVRESCAKMEKYTETREYKRDVLVDKGGSNPPTDEDVQAWADQEAARQSK